MPVPDNNDKPEQTGDAPEAFEDFCRAVVAKLNERDDLVGYTMTLLSTRGVHTTSYGICTDETRNDVIDALIYQDLSAMCTAVLADHVEFQKRKNQNEDKIVTPGQSGIVLQ